METTLFELQLTEKRKELLRKTHFWAKIFLLCATGTGLFNLYNSYKLASFYLSIPAPEFSSFKVHSVASIVFLILYAIMIPLQAYLFYNFTSKSRKAISYDDAGEFNSSYEWLLRQVVVAAILFGLNTIWGIIDVCVFGLENQ